MSEPLLVAEDLNKHYGGVHAVRGVSLSVSGGEVLGLIGPNGAGKTTLVDLITGVQPADSGRITIRGRAVTGPPSRRARAGLARTFQHPQLAPDLSVRENVLLGRLHRRMGGVADMVGTLLSGLARPIAKADAEAVEEVLHALGIGRPDRRWGDLTLGEQRLVEVARALAQEPDVLLLDEPFAGSDADGEAGIREAIAEVRRRGHGVVLVDHNVDIVASLVHRVVLMAEGAKVFDGDPAACMRSAEMRRVYFGADDTAAAGEVDA